MPHASDEKPHAVFVREFSQITGLVPIFEPDYERDLAPYSEYLLRAEGFRPLLERRREFLAHVNRKFRLNSSSLGHFYGEAAGRGVTFNFHQKAEIQRGFDLRDWSITEGVLRKKGVPRKHTLALARAFTPITPEATIRHLKSECDSPSKLRREKGDRRIDLDIVQSHFSAFLWVSAPLREIHRYFDPEFNRDDYQESFWQQLHGRSSQLFSREGALQVVYLDSRTLGRADHGPAPRDLVSNLLSRLYETTSNYGYVALVVEPTTKDGRSVEWQVVADATLFAEKHREEPLDKSFFRWKDIRSVTRKHVPGIDDSVARFELSTEGFSYKDCFVLTREDALQRLLVLFQKNHRDETLIPCPTCRSRKVRGNSYPTLGVRSWECSNLLCTDRSKYNRGKRYSFKGLMMQQAIEDHRNEIPLASVRRWSRDVVEISTLPDVLDMLVRHYSMADDAVHLHNWPSRAAKTEVARRLVFHDLPQQATSSEFWHGPFFARYVTTGGRRLALPVRNLGDSSFQVLLGDAVSALSAFPDETFDGSVTSPPYYNAREYSQWPNIYCYLHDMMLVGEQVFRTLKAGADYLYNVFDYFDNENTITYSAMGQKRVPLSAYTVDLFTRIGFELVGNVVWDKGSIEGKRGFNAGNFAPYYQSPFNCWEHVLVFRKPPASQATTVDAPMPQVLREKPVIKIVRGRNVHGHTAPFPDAIPQLLVSRLRPGGIVLDPFGGSLTTGRVAEGYGIRSVCIEQSEEFCRLGLQMRERARARRQVETAQLALF